jgi:hypothetical protein
MDAPDKFVFVIGSSSMQLRELIQYYHHSKVTMTTNIDIKLKNSALRILRISYC